MSDSVCLQDPTRTPTDNQSSAIDRAASRLAELAAATDRSAELAARVSAAGRASGTGRLAALQDRCKKDAVSEYFQVDRNLDYGVDGKDLPYNANYDEPHSLDAGAVDGNLSDGQVPPSHVLAGGVRTLEQDLGSQIRYGGGSDGDGGDCLVHRVVSSIDQCAISKHSKRD